MNNRKGKLKKAIAATMAAVGIAMAAALCARLLVLAFTTEALNVSWNDWISNLDYEDSWTLSSHVETDMSQIMRYIGLKQILEEDDGSLNLDRPVLLLQTADGSVERYSMRQLIDRGEKYGIYVYDGITEWSAYYYRVDTSGETPVRVLWSLMESGSQTIGVDEDVWAVREQQISEAEAAAQSGENALSLERVPEREELELLSTDALIELAEELDQRYSGVSAVETGITAGWRESLDELRRYIQNEEGYGDFGQTDRYNMDGVTEAYAEDAQSQSENGPYNDMEVPEETAYSGVISDYEYDLREEILERFDEARAEQEKASVYLGRLCQNFLMDYLQEYYIYRNLLDGNDRNLSYQVTLEKNGVKRVYSDQNTARSGKTPEISDFSTYYLYDSITQKVDTNFKDLDWNYMVRSLHVNTSLDYDSAAIVVGLPDVASMAYEDSYYEEAVSYTGYRSQVFGIAGSMVVSVIMALAAMIWLMFLSGHREGVEGICLNGYDRIPTELGILGILALCWVEMLAAWLTYRVLENYQSYTAGTRFLLAGSCVTGLVLLAYLILWLGLYGLVRRLKAHTIWKNSLLYRFFHWCLRPVRWCAQKIRYIWNLVLNTGDSAWKTFAIFCAYFVINFVWCYSLRYAGGLSWFLYLVFNGAVALFLLWKAYQKKQIRSGVKKIADGNLDYHLPLENLTGEDRRLAEQINHISVGLKNAVETSVKNERMKTDLITNVSHDIKTPLTSIINYVDLIKRENIQDEKIRGYIDVLDKKSQRLKTLTEDLVEASKASSGTLRLNLEKIDFVELINQTGGEFMDRFEARDLTVVQNITEGPVCIMADGRYVWRILENLYRNTEKYAMPGTRVYIDVFEKFGRIFFVMKNVSEAPLNIKADELTERFIRGDVSRSTEGSGLGLSIARDMTELMNGTFKIYLDGDLFRVTVSFAVISQEKTDLKQMEEEIRRKVAEEEARKVGETAGRMDGEAYSADDGFNRAEEAVNGDLSDTGKSAPKRTKLSKLSIPVFWRKKQADGTNEKMNR